MTGLKRVLRALDRTTTEQGQLGIWVALASGLFVALPVARFFLVLDFDDFGYVAAPLLGGLAFVCTMAGSLIAMRAPTTGKAIAWVLAMNILPPTVACAPSIYGVVISLPSGVLAATLVLPLVLIARHGRDKPGQASRERLLGSLWLAAMTAALVIVELDILNDPWPRREAVGLVPVVITAMTALGLALSTLAVDGFRLWIWRGVTRGAFPGLRAKQIGKFSAVIERYEETGAGPLRSAPTREGLGQISASPARTVIGALAATSAVVLAGCTAWVCLLPQVPSPW